MRLRKQAQEESGMGTKILKYGLIGALLAYIGISFGKIAEKHDKNPILYGILSLISPVNLIILGYWAFSDYESERKPQARTRERNILYIPLK